VIPDEEPVPSGKPEAPADGGAVPDCAEGSRGPGRFGGVGESQAVTKDDSRVVEAVGHGMGPAGQTWAKATT
jgi:hypothetical protein